MDDSEIEDLEEDAAANDIMSTKKSATKSAWVKSKSPKKPASDADVEDLTNRTSRLAVSKPVFVHYSATLT